MAACANHPNVQATAFCRTCGKPLCDQCKKEVRGVVYCEDCLVAHLQNVMPPAAAATVTPTSPYIDPQTGQVRGAGTPNPTLAAFLGFIPGVGAFYNGQYQKGVVHVLMLPAIIMLCSNVSDGFWPLFPAYFLYMPWDAYMTAKSRLFATPAPDPLGINNMFGLESQAGVAAEADATGQVAQRNKGTIGGMPVGAVVLIGLGIIFLLGDINERVFRHFPPLVLLAFGIWRAIAVWEVK